MSTAVDQTARAEIRELREAVKTLFGKLDTFGGKFDAINTATSEIRVALSNMQASSGPGLRDILVITVMLATLFTGVASGIIYLARGGNTEAIHALDKRVYGVELMMKLASPKAMSLLQPEAGK